MPFLHANLSLRKWRQRLGSVGGKPKANNAARGFSAPPDLESGPPKVNGEYPVVKQYSEGLPVQSPQSIEHEGTRQESVAMPEPSFAHPGVEIPTPVQMPVPDTSDSKASSPSPTADNSQSLQAPTPPIAMDPVQSLTVTGVAARVQAGPPTRSKRESALNQIQTGASYYSLLDVLCPEVLPDGR